MWRKSGSALTTRWLRHPREWLWQIGRLFPPGHRVDSVTTRARFLAPRESVWQTIMFFEEVPRRPSLLLRIFLPSPIRTDAMDKCVGAIVKCRYNQGSLAKRITVSERPELIRFQVIEQHLGIERCIMTVEGAYELGLADDGCEVALTTQYRGNLRPRWLWQPIERLLAHQLHLHILNGMRDATMPMEKAAEGNP